jgi:hypothetical protein
MEAQAAHTPVCLGITAFCAGEHNIKHEEGQKDSKYSDELQNGRSRNEAVFFFSCCLNKRSKHNANAQEITDVREVDVEVPADRVNIVEDSKRCNTAYKTKGDIDRLKN